MTAKATRDGTEQKKTSRLPALGLRSKSRQAQNEENPITAAKRPKQGMQKLGPGRTRLGRKRNAPADAVPAVPEMALTPSKPILSQPITRAAKRRLLDVDFKAQKAGRLARAETRANQKQEATNEVKSPPTQLDVQVEAEAPSGVQEVPRSETPEHRAESPSGRSSTFFKQLLLPVYTLFRGDKPGDSNTSSQETSPQEHKRARSCSKSLRAESPEDFPNCAVNTFSVSEKERQQSRHATPELAPQGSETDDAELDSNDEEETSIRVLQDRLASQEAEIGSEAFEDAEGEDDDSDLEETCDPYLFIKILPPLENSVPPWRRCLLPKQKQKRKTLVLDLDETLIHTELRDECSPQSWFKMMIGPSMKYVCVGKRPHLNEFLERCAATYEVVVFTASLKHYADAVIDRIDPTRKLIQHRLFRDSCLQMYGNYMKDLSALGRDLSQTLIIDNSPQAYGYQLENGIPIESWYDNPQDRELLSMLQILETLVKVPDVRPVIRETFETHKLVEAATLPSPSPQLEVNVDG